MNRSFYMVSQSTIFLLALLFLVNSVSAAPLQGDSLKIQDGSVLFSGTEGLTPTSGEGTRFMWIPAKGALRAGSVSGIQWDDASIGANSVALGTDVIASGNSAVALGQLANASGDYSFALSSGTASGYLSIAAGPASVASGYESSAYGIGSYALGSYSTALGFSSVANGTSSVALGSSSVANGLGSVALGTSSSSDGLGSVSIGYFSNASGTASTALGYRTNASGAYSTVIGTDSIASGSSSFAVGDWVKATGQNSIVIGKGLNSVSPLVNSLVASLMIGFGSKPTLFVNGTSVGIGTTATVTTFDVNGPMRLVPLSVAPKCSFATEGAIYYDKAKKAHFGCDGNKWNSLYDSSVKTGGIITQRPR